MKKSLAAIIMTVVVSLLPAILPAVAWPADAPKLTAEEQNAKSVEVFERILKLTRERDRAAVAPKMEEGYREIIDKYPDSNRVQESYWRLMLLYMANFTPPAYDKAEQLLVEYRKKFPSQALANPVYDTLLENYYKNARWEELLRLCRPVIRDFIEKGTLERPQELFYHSEAKFNLGVAAEAVKGYRIIVARFPASAEAASSKKRLEEIEKKTPAKK